MTTFNTNLTRNGTQKICLKLKYLLFYYRSICKCLRGGACIICGVWINDLTPNHCWSETVLAGCWMLQHSADPKEQNDFTFTFMFQRSRHCLFWDNSLKIISSLGGVRCRKQTKHWTNILCNSCFLNSYLGDANFPIQPRRTQDLVKLWFLKSYPLCSVTCGASQEIEEHPSSSQR